MWLLLLVSTLVVYVAVVVFIAIDATTASTTSICVDVAAAIDDVVITGRGAQLLRAICASVAFLSHLSPKIPPLLMQRLPEEEPIRCSDSTSSFLPHRESPPCYLTGYNHSDKVLMMIVAASCS